MSTQPKLQAKPCSFELLIENDQGERRTLPLQTETITIGRARNNDVQLDEYNVSRHHARLVQVDGGFIVEEVSARYGTQVNDELLDGREPLGREDTLQIGDYTLHIQPVGGEAANLDEESSRSIPHAKVSDEALLPIAQQGRLVVISESLMNQRFALRLFRVLLGRSEDCDAQLNHPSVSREHAMIAWDEEQGFAIRNLSEKNPILVNGKAIESHKLREGDKILMGEVRLRFCDAGSSWQYFSASPVRDRAAPSTPLLVLGVALLLALVAVGTWFVVRPTPDAPKAPAITPQDPTHIELSLQERSQQAEVFAAECRARLTEGALSVAAERCGLALERMPEEKKYQSLSAEVASAQMLRANIAEVNALVAAEDCEAASKKIAGAPTLAAETTTAVTGCFNASISRKFSEVLRARGRADAATYLETAAKNLSPAIHADLSAKLVVPEQVKPVKREGKVSVKEASPQEVSPEDRARSEALAKKAGTYLLNDPTEAVKLYKEALGIYSNTRMKRDYAIALVRAQQPCRAAKVYKQIRKRLKGSDLERANKVIDGCP